MESQLEAIAATLARYAALPAVSEQLDEGKNAVVGTVTDLGPRKRGRLYEKFSASGDSAVPSSFPKPNEAREKSKKLSVQIFNDYDFLHNILERHELTIQKRWRKKTTEQRRKILLTAWPNMSPQHRPDFEAVLKESSLERWNGTKFKKAFMWPYINLEDLLKPKFLLLFLKNRGRSPPHVFALADYDAIQMGIGSKAVKAPFLNGHTMVFADRKSPQSYGELVSWTEQPRAENWVELGIGIPPNQGMMILEIQQKVLSFLVHCCLQILPEVPKENLLRPQYPVQPEPPITLGKNEMGYPSLSVVAAEAPYRVPATLDFACLGAIVASRRAEAEDHIWSLKEDPSYFSQVMLDYKEYSQELIPDKYGRPLWRLRELSQLQFWDRVIGQAVTEAYMDLMIWDNIDRLVTDLIDMESNSPLKELPVECLEILKLLYQLLQVLSSMRIQNLRAGLPASEPFRKYFNIELPGPGATEMHIRGAPMSQCARSAGHLLWLFTSLVQPEQVSLMGLHNLLDELERHTQVDPKAKSLITLQVSRWIFDLSITAECMHNIDHYYPWGRSIQRDATAANAPFSDILFKSQSDSASGRSSLQRSFEGYSFGPSCIIDPAFAGANLADLGKPEDKRFYYPVDKRRTKESTTAMRSAEANLDKFWKAVDQHRIAASKQAFEFIGALLDKDRTIQRTPEWVEAITQRGKSSNNIGLISVPLSEFYFDLENRTERTVSREAPQGTQSKAKIKTKSYESQQGLVKLSDETSISPSYLVPSATPPASTPLIFVDRRSLRTLNTLFHVPSSHHQPGELAWVDFLHAMSATGLSPQKLYGSVWQFNPGHPKNSKGTKEDGYRNRSIQFHEPHPAPKVPFVTARCWGRRLHRTYGWSARSFGLEEEAR